LKYCFEQVHEEELVGVGIACNGLYIMSCSKDGNMIIWDLKGGILERVKVPMEVATCAKVSPCGRLEILTIILSH
jgi:WD40 repeat protein